MTNPPGPDSPQAEAAAKRLRLPVHKDRWSQPWRYFILLYLAHCIEVDDYEGRHFGHVGAKMALQQMRNDLDDLLHILERRKGG